MKGKIVLNVVSLEKGVKWRCKVSVKTLKSLGEIPKGIVGQKSNPIHAS